jgi:hypothetical protein
MAALEFAGRANKNTLRIFVIGLFIREPRYVFLVDRRMTDRADEEQSPIQIAGVFGV